MRRAVLLPIVLCLGFAAAPPPKSEGQRVLRIRLDPKKLAAHGVKAADVPRILGFTGLAPVEVSFTWRGKFTLEVVGTPVEPLLGGPKEYGKLILRATSQGEILRLEDVARIELRSR